MKELSIEEKARAYDEAIEKFDVILNLNTVKESGTIFADDVRKIFPELKESEDDDEIRKDILNYIKHNYDGQHISISRYDSWIAWLERQCKPQIRTGLEWVNTIDDACDKRYSEEYAHGEYCHEQSFKWGFQEGVDWLEKQGEQKPAAWSEEDEAGLSDAMWAIEQARTIAKDENDMGNLWYAEHWLESLRPQNTWKPSDEQIKGIECAIKTLQHQLNVGDKRLNSLYDDLKKLIEE